MLDEAAGAPPVVDGTPPPRRTADPGASRGAGERAEARILVWALVALGVLLRLWLLTHRPFLWLDEAHLAPNVLDRGWRQLFSPAINEQMAPYGWLALAKLSSLIPISQESALRLPAAISGIAALCAVAALTRTLKLGAIEQIGAVALAALSPAWIYYSAEFKQYSTELLCTLLVTLAAARALRSPRQQDRWPLYLAGLATVLLALSAPLTLGTLGAYLMVRDAIARRWRALLVLAAVALAWVGLFALHLHSLSDPATRAKMSGTWWANGFAPWSIGLPKWLGHALLDYGSFLSGVEAAAALYVCLFAAGMIGLLRDGDKHAAWLCGLPALAALGAAMLHLYPFEGRLLLFASGGVVIAAGNGIGVIARALRTRWSLAAVAVMLLPAMLPILAAGLRQAVAQHDDPLPDLIGYVARERKPDELVYVHALGLPIWRVYAPRYPSLNGARGTIIAGRDSRAGLDYYLADLQALQGRGKVWMLFARASGQEQDDRALGDYVARLRGTILQRKREGSAEALLVDFTKPGPADLAPPNLPTYQPIHSSYRLEP